MELNSAIDTVLKQYGLNNSGLSIERINAGHINHTYNVGSEYVLQRINKEVFKNPEILSHNLKVASDHLKINAPDYLFLHVIKSITGEDLVFDEAGYPWRLFPYIKNTVSINEVTSAQQAYAAANAFAGLTRRLAGCDVSEFKETISRFHDLSLRYEQFEIAISQSTTEKIQLSSKLIEGYKSFHYLVERYNELVQSQMLVVRITHNDTKINNVLFNQNKEKVICVIDLDTLMPGYFIYDLGDMIRTFVCPVSEEEKDISAIRIRKDIYGAIVEGYLSEMSGILTPQEKEVIPVAGSLMTYMIGLRFLTDFLNGDLYYHTSYPKQNMYRAANQLRLLQLLVEQA